MDDSPFTNKKLSDVNATENDPDLSIDLTGLFGDIDNEPSEIILSGFKQLVCCFCECCSEYSYS